MITYHLPADSTDVSVVLRIIDSADGTPETGVVFNTSGIDLEYRREGAASTDITEATLAALTTAHTDGGFLHIGNGYYRLDLPDAAVATGVSGVLVHGVVTGMVVIGCYIQLTPAPANVQQISGSAVSTTTAQLGVNVVQVSGDSGAADNAEAFFDGTGYAGTNNVIPTVTTVTNQVAANVTAISGDTTSADNLEAYTDGTTPMPVNVTQISGDATAADNLESYTDGTTPIPANATQFAGTAYATQRDALVDLIWDEVLTGATHNVTNSAGQRLRQVTDNIVTSGTAQAGATASITLASGASSTDGTYDPGLVRIVAGTGIGQVRMIIQYVGSTRVASVDRDWRTAPDNTSEYQIVAAPNLVSTNEGLAQGGASTTITLNAQASATNDVYIGQTVVLRTGTGQDQSRIISAYNGTTKVATVAQAWQTNPASGTGYIIWPTGRALVAAIVDNAITAAATAADFVTELQSGLATSSALSTVSGLVDDLESRLGTPSNLGSGATIAANLVDIESQTDDIGTAGAGLSAVPWNAAWDAEVQSEVADALVAYDPPTRAELTSDTNSILLQLQGLVLSQGTIGGTGNSTTAVHLAGLTYGDDEINNYLLVIFDVSESEYHSRWIEDWANTGDLATVATLPFTPQNSTDLFWLLPVRQDVTGGSGLDAAGVRAAIGMASANLDTQLAAIDDAVDTEVAAIITTLGTPAGASVSADIADIEGKVDDLEGRLTSTRAGYLDNLSAGAVALQSTATAIETDTQDIQSRLPAALVSGRIDASVGAMASDTLTSAALAASAVTEIQSGLSTVTTAQVNSEVDTALADVGLTTTITGRIDAAISTRATPAQVNTEVDTALADIRLDELLSADSDIDGAAPPTVGSVFHELMTKTAGSFTYDQTTDSLEAVRDRGDAAWTTATGFLDAAGVRSAVGLASANLDTQLAAIDDAVDTEVASIVSTLAAGVTLTNAGIDAILDRSNGVETGYTLRQALRLMAAALLGELSGAATATITIRDMGDTKTRITATVTADGDRTALTLDAS